MARPSGNAAEALPGPKQAVSKALVAIVPGRRDNSERNVHGRHRRTIPDRQIVPMCSTKQVRRSVAEDLPHRACGNGVAPLQFDQRQPAFLRRTNERDRRCFSCFWRNPDAGRGRTLIEPLRHVAVVRQHRHRLLQERLVALKAAFSRSAKRPQRCRSRRGGRAVRFHAVENLEDVVNSIGPVEQRRLLVSHTNPYISAATRIHPRTRLLPTTLRHRRTSIGRMPAAFLPYRCRLSPTGRLASCPDSARPSPDPDLSARGHSAPRINAALVHSIPTKISTEMAPHSRPVFKSADEVSNQATVASVTTFEIALQGRHMATGESSILNEVLRLLGNDQPIRGVLAALLSHRTIDKWKYPPAVVDLTDAEVAVSPCGTVTPAEEARQRLDTVTAVALPGSRPDRPRRRSSRSKPDLIECHAIGDTGIRSGVPAGSGAAKRSGALPWPVPSGRKWCRHGARVHNRQTSNRTRMRWWTNPEKQL